MERTSKPTAATSQAEASSVAGAAPGSPNAPAAGKRRPYSPPTVTRLGTVLELTQVSKHSPENEFPQQGSGL